jgi:hypothetical protein
VSLMVALAVVLLAVGPRDAPTLAELRNATYRGGLSDEVTLKGGRWVGPPDEEAGGAHDAARLVEEAQARGDVDGDGEREAVAVFQESGAAGNGLFSFVAVMKRRESGIEDVATALIGDRVELWTARIEGRRILLEGLRAGKGDGLCCASELVEWEWVLEPWGLKASEPRALGRGRRELEALQGTEWALHEWESVVATPADSTPTLRYDHGRVQGSTGCRAYAGAARDGITPGDLSLVPRVISGAPCPGPKAAVEARFLRRLRGAKHWGFDSGRLTVVYDTESHGRGRMTFEAAAGTLIR